MRLGWWLIIIALFPACSPSEKRPAPVDLEAVSAEAIRRLVERGHDAGEVFGGGWQRFKYDGNSCSLLTPHVENGDELVGEKDARLLGQVQNLVEIRVLPNGGPSDEFWDELGQIDSLLEFAVHYGLTEKGIRSLSKFPNLKIFTVWGGDYWGESTSLKRLPPMPKLLILHFEESPITTDDFRHLKEMCPVLEEFRYDYELLPDDIEILRSIPSLNDISAFNFELEDGKVIPNE